MCESGYLLLIRVKSRSVSCTLLSRRSETTRPRNLRGLTCVGRDRPVSRRTPGPLHVRSFLLARPELEDLCVVQAKTVARARRKAAGGPYLQDDFVVDVGAVDVQVKPTADGRPLGEICE